MQENAQNHTIFNLLRTLHNYSKVQLSINSWGLMFELNVYRLHQHIAATCHQLRKTYFTAAAVYIESMEKVTEKIKYSAIRKVRMLKGKEE